jgi:Flp pilus assembly protein TadG
VARRGTRAARESGAATAELVVATPLLMLLVLLVVQFALYLHALHVAQAAAAQALAAARAENGSVAAGQDQAALTLDQLAGDLLTDTHVTVTRGAAEARVQVAGTAQQVVPFLRLPVGTVAHGPVEVFTPPEAEP